MKFNHSSINKIIAFFVFAFTFSVYIYIAAPSISFWDCGEYVATGSSLGIAHPPGNPLYIMIARCATIILPFIKDPAFRINALTPFFGSFTVMFIYLSIIRIFCGFSGTPDTLRKQFIFYISGIVGSFFAGFSNTMLFSAVEAEVNMPLLLPIILSTWLALVWSQSKSPDRDRILLLIAYICFLGIGIHMYSMISLIPVFIFVVICDRTKLVDWRFWCTSFLMGLVIFDISIFLYCSISVILLTLILSIFKNKNQKKWQFCFLLAFLSFTGFSSHLYIPVRSAINPSIDESHPATFSAFKDYLDRKQYGSESMVSRMFWRRGELQNQFGVEGHMGFGGFFATQFFHISINDTSIKWFSKDKSDGAKKLIIYLIPVIFMLAGLFILLKKSRNVAIFILLLLFLNTIAMVIYMNFSDGTKPERRDYENWIKNNKNGPVPVVQREVRVRDYFYITGFMYYGMCIGLSSGLVMLALYSNRRKFVSGTATPFVMILFAVSPVLPMTQNIPINNRHADMIPYDYAYNLLMSCDENAILFTNGDNDTFPLWALQEAFNFRKDVRIVNLSLLNTDWYIYQLKHYEPKVPMTISDTGITMLNHSYNQFNKPTPHHLDAANILVYIPSGRQLPLIQIQHQMVLHIVDANRWERPVYFANTVSDDAFVGLDPYLSMQGFVYRIEPDSVPENMKFDIACTEYLIDSIYNLRGLDTWRAENDETTQSLVSNNSAVFLKIGLALRENIAKRNAQIDSIKKQAVEMSALTEADSIIDSLHLSNLQDFKHGMNRLNQCTKFIPWDWRPYMLRYELYTAAGRSGDAEDEIALACDKFPDNVDLLRLKVQTLLYNRELAAAVPTLKKLCVIDEDPSFAYYVLSQIYKKSGKFDSAASALNGLKRIHPDDKQVDQLIEENKSLAR
jgi:hypothetical protein